MYLIFLILLTVFKKCFLLPCRLLFSTLIFCSFLFCLPCKRLYLESWQSFAIFMVKGWDQGVDLSTLVGHLLGNPWCYSLSAGLTDRCLVGWAELAVLCIQCSHFIYLPKALILGRFPWFSTVFGFFHSRDPLVYILLSLDNKLQIHGAGGRCSLRDVR